MVGRFLTLLVVLYIALDFTNPHMPGAVTFDPTKSVEGVHAERGRLTPSVTIALPARPVRLTEAAAPRVSDDRLALFPPPRWRTPFHRRLTTSDTLAVPSEDH